MLSKVPEVTIWFWVIKILCTTVGESFADWINVGLGLGLTRTALFFSVVLVIVLGIQLRLNRYVPVVYWLVVVVLSVAGTLYTDILTDRQGIPLVVTSSVFAVVLAAVFGIWFARERTLSIHSIITVPRELFYWLAVLVTFALGTAVGDWTLQVTGWGRGVSVLLPAGLIVAIIVGWRLGANAVLSFWFAYILTRPLGANLGDWFASPLFDGGLGLGYGITSVIFLAAILGSVGYLTVSRIDVIAARPRPDGLAVARRPNREKAMLGYYAAVAVATGVLLVWASAHPHAAAGASREEEVVPSPAPGSVQGRNGAAFPSAEIAKFRGIAQDTLARVQAGDQAGAVNRVKDLETAWDHDQATLQPMNSTAWSVLDGQIDAALKAVRASNPDRSDEIRTLTKLLGYLR
ncbi:hypothetical protein ACKUVQ_15715 [Mycobacterium seoulense]|uniref:COG4705 family protein n=1 Tax=Mycobacterium seoulense TaxID=386911 RepID=UPI003CF601EC